MRGLSGKVRRALSVATVSYLSVCRCIKYLCKYLCCRSLPAPRYLPIPDALGNSTSSPPRLATAWLTTSTARALPSGVASA
jgi:hypothetical protein